MKSLGLVFLLLLGYALQIDEARADGSVHSGSYYETAGQVGCTTPVADYHTIWSCELAVYAQVAGGGIYTGCGFIATGATSTTWTVYSPGGTGCPPAGFELSGSITFSTSYCPAHSTSTSSPCTCSTGYVPTSDGVHIDTSGNGTSCSSTIGVTKTAPVPQYAVNTNSTTCTGTPPTSCYQGTSLFSSASGACGSLNDTGNNYVTNCSAVAQNSTCICSTTFSDGSVPYMASFPIVRADTCPTGDTQCKLQQAATDAQNLAAAKAANAVGASTLANGGTAASAVTAATTAAGIVNNTTNMATTVDQGVTYNQYGGTGGGSGGTVTLASNPMIDFCSANPLAGMCVALASGTFSGSCGSAPACTDSDAVVCAEAVADFGSACALAQQYVTGTTESTVTSNAVAGTDTGNTSSPALTGNRTVTDLSSAVSGGSPVFTRSGLADVNYNTSTAYPVTIPYSKLNAPLTVVGTIGVAVTFLFALFIVFF